MKHFIFKTSLLVFPVFLSSQTTINQESKPSLDTVKVCDCRLSRSQTEDVVTYKIDDKIVTAEKYKKINSGYQQIEKCAPCYLKTYTLEETLLSAGIIYYHCPTNAANAPVQF